MREIAIEIESLKTGEIHPAVYEHPLAGAPLPLAEQRCRCL